MTGAVIDEALGALRASVRALLDAPLDAMPSAEVVPLLAELETLRRQLEAVDVRVLAEAETRREAPVRDVLITTLRVAPGDARRRLDAASDLGPRRALSGEPLEPVLPRAAQALAAGAISLAHVTVISKTVEKVERLRELAAPIAVHEVVPVVEQVLLDAALHQHPAALQRTAAMLLARLDPDGPEPHDDLAERSRDFTLHTDAEGMSVARWRMTPECAALWLTVLDSLAPPAPAQDGEPDPRTPGQRRHDAMTEAAHRLLRSDLPASGGSPVTVLIRTTLTDLLDEHGVAVTAHGATISSDLVRWLLPNAVTRLVLENDCEVLALGREQRLASKAQRLALAARDGGCAFPGCDRPAAWTEVHHIVEWKNGGSTDIDNMCLLCFFHHRNFEQLGWTVRITDGHPEWTPPAWLDPHQQPRRNTTHHALDLPIQAASR